jgi:biopolymer transport protein ExbB/TolQ
MNTLFLAAYGIISWLWLYLDVLADVKKMKEELKQKEKRIKELEDMIEVKKSY